MNRSCSISSCSNCFVPRFKCTHPTESVERLHSDHVFDVAKGVSAGRDQPCCGVSGEHGEGSVGITDADPRHRVESTALWLSEDPHHAASRRLASEPQTRAPTVSARRIAGAATHSTTQAVESASRTGAAAGRGQRALEHGLRARSARRRTIVSDADGHRQLESRECATGGGFQAVRRSCCGGAEQGRRAAWSTAFDHRRPWHRVHLEVTRRVGLPEWRLARLHATWKAHGQWPLRVVQWSTTR